MPLTADYQFELEGYTFGDGCPIFVDAEGFDTGELTFITQDTTNPITGATMMGRDVLKPPDWSWTLHVNRDDQTQALAELAALGRAMTNNGRGWQDSREALPLRYQLDGRIRRVYGRPRRFSFKPGNRLWAGYLPPMASFARVDALHYDDNEQQVTLGLEASVPGGFSWPITWPLTFNRDADFVRPGGVVVGGDAPTWPVVTFYGPCTNPKVTIGEFQLGMSGMIEEFGSVTIDTRPWAQSVKRVGNTSAAKLSATTRFTQAKLEPGDYEAVYTATDITGESTCQVRWRDAWTTL